MKPKAFMKSFIQVRHIKRIVFAIEKHKIILERLNSLSIQRKENLHFHGWVNYFLLSSLNPLKKQQRTDISSINFSIL